MAEFYLGDGLYVSFDGWHFALRAPRADGDQIVYLEKGRGGTLENFLAYMNAQFADVEREEIRVAEDKVRGDFRQGVIRHREAVAQMRELGHEDAQAIVDEWLSELEWDEVAQDHRRASHD